MGKIKALMETLLGKANGVASLDADKRNAQPPKLHAGEHKTGGADEITPDMIWAIGAVGAYYGHDAAESLDDILDASFTIGLSSDRYTALRAKLGNPAWATGIQVFFSTKSTTTSRMQLLVGSTGRCATRYYFSNNNAWGEWQAAATTDYALNKAGDTMTGNLRIKKGSPVVYVTDSTYGREGRLQHNAELTYIHNLLDNEHYAAILLGKETTNMANLLRVQQKNGDALNTYTVLHTGNKPSSFYGGVGGTTEWTHNIGGTGSLLYIWSDYSGVGVFVNQFGAFTINAGTYERFTVNEVYFANGVLHIKTENNRFNTAGKHYYYQLL